MADQRPDDQMLTIDEVARRAKVNPRTVRRWIDRGELVAYQLGPLVRIAERDYRAYLAERRTR
jgi:excisionase family DNA binding protein